MKLHWSVVEPPRRPALLAASRRPPTAAGPTVPTTSRSTPRRFNAHPLRAVRSQTVILYYLESKDRDWPRYLKRSYVKGAGINRDCNDDIRNSIFHNKMDSSIYTNLRKALYKPFISEKAKLLQTKTFSLSAKLRFQLTRYLEHLQS